MGDVDILLCPSTAEEKRTWLDLIQQAGYVSLVKGNCTILVAYCIMAPFLGLV